MLGKLRNWWATLGYSSKGIVAGDSVRILSPAEYEGITGVVADIQEPEAGDWMTLHIEFDRPMYGGLDNEYFTPFEVEKQRG